jgi:hypothetical protein
MTINQAKTESKPYTRTVFIFPTISTTKQIVFKFPDQAIPELCNARIFDYYVVLICVTLAVVLNVNS